MIFARRQAAALRQIGVTVHEFHLESRTSPKTLVREFFRFRRWLSRLNPDVIHAHFGTVTGLFCVLASGAKPVVITYRGSDLNSVPASQGLRATAGRLFSQLSALVAARLVCVSEGLQEQLWWRQSRSLVLPSGVDLTYFRPLPQTEARRRLGWAPQTRVVLFNAGHDGRNKRLDLAKAALACLRTREPNLDSHLAILHGNVPPGDMPWILNAADCLLITSDAEGSPSILQEALACNLPVVSVPVGDAPERLRGVANTRLAGRDPDLLAEALADLLRTPCRSDGRQRSAVFSSDRIALRLAELYEGLTGNPGAAQRLPPWNTSHSSPSRRF